MNYKAKIGRGEPMPSICKICSSVYNCKGEKNDIPQENPCFVDYFKSRGYPEDAKLSDEQKDRILSYAPYTNSKRTVKTTCGNFAHVRTYRIR